ncbi:amidohydrolase family protein [Verrucomicrobiota bacterium]
MILDGHIHIRGGSEDPGLLARRFGEAGVEGGSIISLPPSSFRGFGEPLTNQERLDNLLSWCRAGSHLYPFYWIDPLENDAAEQVDVAVAGGVRGFKVICNRFPPGHEKAMPVYRSIARAGKPMLFHSGILWDGAPSSPFNRPAGFEALLEVDGLRFCLAHISWPWCDECLAVYGKFLNAFTRRSGLSVEMFIDVTPGTPPIYRREALTKLYTIGYDVESNVIFGSDSCANDYGTAWVREWIERDTAILGELGVSGESVELLMSGNLLRFVGEEGSGVRRKAPKPGE